MNWSSLMILGIQLMLIPAVASAQTETAGASPLVIDCTSTSQKVTLKRHPPSDNGLSSQQQSVVRSGSFTQKTVTELPKLQYIEFLGLTAIKESEALRLLCQRGAFRAARAVDLESAHTGASVLTEILKAQGYANAEVQAFADQKQTFRFFVNEGMRVPLAEVRFEGNKNFSSDELSSLVNNCLARFEGDPNSYDQDKLKWCERNLLYHIRNSGYLQAKLSHTAKVSQRGYVVSFALEEGVRYRLGKIKIDREEAFSEEQIRSRFTLREGDIARGDSISKWLFEDLKKAYGELGFIQYTAEPVPTFKPDQGIVDFDIQIDEGKGFSLRSITFVGDLIDGISVERLLLLHVGDVYNHRLFRESIERLNSIGLFAPVDADRDVEFSSDSENGLVQLTINLRKRE